MWRRSFLINILIVVGILFSAKQLVSAWEGFQKSHSLKNVAAGALILKDASAGGTIEPARSMPPFTDFMVVAERNLFTPERQPEPESSDTSAPTPPELSRNPDLNGITTLGGQKRAFLTLYEGKKQEKKSKVVTLGDSVQGYRVSEIGDTNLTMKWNDHAITIDLSTQGAQQAAAASKAVGAVTVITVGSAAAAVETTKSAAAKAQEEKGLEVAVVGSQAGRGTANRQGGLRGGRGGRGRGGDNRSLGADGRRGLPSTVGVGGGGRRGRSGGVGQSTIGTGSRRQRGR